MAFFYKEDGPFPAFCNLEENLNAHFFFFFPPLWMPLQVNAATKSEHPENNFKLKRSANNKKEIK